MNKFIFIFLASSLFVTGSPFSGNELQVEIENDNQNEPIPLQNGKPNQKVTVINQNTKQIEQHSLREVAIQVETIKKLISQSLMPEPQKNSLLTKLISIGNAVKDALSIGASLAIIIAGGYLLLKIYRFGSYTKSNIIDPTIDYIKDDILAPCIWLLKLPTNLMPQNIKDFYIAHNEPNPFI